jgi:hypothetical protein
MEDDENACLKEMLSDGRTIEDNERQEIIEQIKSDIARGEYQTIKDEAILDTDKLGQATLKNITDYFSGDADALKAQANAVACWAVSYKNRLDALAEIERDWWVKYISSMSKTTTNRLIVIDPNSKQGPAGYGEEQFVGISSPLLYRINFENMPEASGPAQTVYITDQLDSSLDWTSFALGNITFGTHTVAVPNGLGYYRIREDLRPEGKGCLVDVEAGLDLGSGRVFWRLTAIDPQTGEPPLDAAIGLLPRNDPATHEGEGHVLYSVKARSDTTTGTNIRNTATIVFDRNEPIDTNQVSNTIDADAPSSLLNPLTPESLDPNMSLSWSGTDQAGGSELADYTIYVSTDGGPFVPFISNTTATQAVYQGSGGHSYAFYSIARDNVGNVESAPHAPDAVTTIAGPPTIVTAVSRKIHGTAGSFDLNLKGSGAIECRHGGPTEVVIVFDKTIEAVGALDSSGVSLSSGAVSNLSINGSELTIQMTGATNGQRLTIRFPGIVGADSAGTALVEDTLSFGVLYGDCNGDGYVNNLDLISTRGRIGKAPTLDTCRYDVNASGRIDQLDLVAVRGHIGNTLASP